MPILGIESIIIASCEYVESAKAKLMPGIIQGLFFILVEDMSSQTRWVSIVR